MTFNGLDLLAVVIVFVLLLIAHDLIVWARWNGRRKLERKRQRGLA